MKYQFSQEIFINNIRFSYFHTHSTEFKMSETTNLSANFMK